LALKKVEKKMKIEIVSNYVITLDEEEILFLKKIMRIDYYVGNIKMIEIQKRLSAILDEVVK